MRITRIQRKRGGRGRALVHVDGEVRCELALDVLRDAGLHVDDEVGEAELTALERADQRHRAREAALGLLAVRARSRTELRRRLRARQLPEDVVEETLSALEGAGLVDDDAFARAFARDRIRFRPRGRAAIAAELRARGVAAQAAEAAVERVFEDEDTSDVSLAREAADAWVRRAPPALLAAARGRDREARDKARRRLYGYLSRRGFPPQAVRRAAEEALADEAGTGEPD